MVRFKTGMITAFLCVISASVLANSAYITVPVLSAQAIYEYDRHREKVCWQEPIPNRGSSQYYDHSSSHYHESSNANRDSQVASGALTGAVVGAAIGHAVSEDRQSQAATTLIGGVVGMVVGGNLADHGRVKVRHRHQSYHREPVSTRQVCDYEYRKRATITGYKVQYRLHGQIFTTNSRHKPGRKLRLRIEPMLN